MSIQVEYVDVPEGAQENAVVASGSYPLLKPNFNLQNIMEGADGSAYATLEPGAWVLDGSRKIMGDESVGWWSGFCSDKDGVLSFVDEYGINLGAPEIKISFPEPYTATGITFTFWPSMGQWCSEIEVFWVLDGNTVAQIVAYPDGPEWFLEYPVEEFDQILIRLRKTSVPYSYGKVQKIRIGQVIVFGTDEITRVGLLNEIDPSLCVLSADTMVVSVRDKVGRMLSPQKNQEIRLYRNGERIASHYIKEFSRESRQGYTFQCQSAVGLLEGDFLGGVYDGTPAAALIGEVLDGIPFYLETDLDVLLHGYLPVCSRREALQQIVFVLGAVLTTQGDGLIRIVPLRSDLQGEFTENDIFQGAKISKEPEISTVQVTAHRYTTSEDDDLQVILDAEEIGDGTQMFVFSEPFYSYTVSNGRIVSCGANWVEIRATDPTVGVTVSGKKYRHTTAVHAYKNSKAKATDRGNVLSVEKATLVHSGNVGAVLERLVAYSSMRVLLTQNVVVRGQKAGQTVSSASPWDTNVVGYISSMESEFTANGHTAMVKIRGKEE